MNIKEIEEELDKHLNAYEINKGLGHTTNSIRGLFVRIYDCCKQLLTHIKDLQAENDELKHELTDCRKLGKDAIAENERLRDCIEEQRYEKHTYKKALLNKHGIEVDDFVPMDKLPKGQTQ